MRLRRFWVQKTQRGRLRLLVAPLRLCRAVVARSAVASLGIAAVGSAIGPGAPATQRHRHEQLSPTRTVAYEYERSCSPAAAGGLVVHNDLLAREFARDGEGNALVAVTTIVAICGHKPEPHTVVRTVG